MKKFSTYTIVLAIFLLLPSCIISPNLKSTDRNGVPNENYAARYPDFTEEGYKKVFKSRLLVMRYKMGDRFRLRKTMFLSYQPTKIVYLCEPSEYCVPSINEYKKNPNAYRYGGQNSFQVIGLVPAGTVIEIVKIAKFGYSPYPHFVIQGKTEWFRSSAFTSDRQLEYSTKRTVHEKGYDKDLFQKL